MIKIKSIAKHYINIISLYFNHVGSPIISHLMCLVNINAGNAWLIVF